MSRLRLGRWAAGGMGSGGDSTGGSGGGDTTCQADETRPCYDGPMGTEDVGVCAAGVQTCDGAAWGACEGQVMPGTEDCASLGDEDCDGVACSDPIWSLVVQGAGWDIVSAARFDSMDPLVVAGWFSDPFDFGGGTLTPTGSDLFVAKYDASGQHLWSKLLPATGTFRDAQLELDGNDNIVLVVSGVGTIDLGGGPLNSASTQDGDIFLGKLAPNGDHVWSKFLTSQAGQVAPVGEKIAR